MPPKPTSPQKLPLFQALSDRTIADCRQLLLNWYQVSGRVLPWRDTQDPYKIWVSEIMLQQTQVKTVLPYYYNWLETFPTVQSLAQADLQDVLKCWEGLGYYARARNFHKAAQVVCERFSGRLPQTVSELESLSGIGRTTAGGIASAAFNLPAAILDGNVKRVLSRLVGLQRPPQRELKVLWQISERLVDPQSPREFNQALMDLGATLCTPKQPDCEGIRSDNSCGCPWVQFCFAYHQQQQSNLPMTEARTPIPHKQIGVAVIWNDQGEVLIDRRPENGLLGGLWEFPGGKIESQETVEDCISREIREEIGIEITVGSHLITVDHAYTHFKVSLIVHHCQYQSGTPQTLACEEIRWVTPDTLDNYPFPKANKRIIEALLSTDRLNRPTL